MPASQQRSPGCAGPGLGHAALFSAAIDGGGLPAAPARPDHPYHRERFRLLRIRNWLAAAGTVAAILLTGAAPASAIVGGSDATSAQPWIVSIQGQHADGSYSHICHGLVYQIHGRIGVATNAHCVTDAAGIAVPVTAIRLSAGSRLDAGRIYKVKAIKVRDGWDWATPGPDGPDQVDDLATLIPTNTRGLHPIDITDRTTVSQVRLFGWGSTTPSGEGPLPQRLQQLDSTIVDPSNCASVLISAGEVCVLSRAGTGLCNGDGGDPAEVRTHGGWAVLGSASRQEGGPCGTSPTVFTDLRYFHDWLAHALTDASTGRTRPHQVAPAGNRALFHVAAGSDAPDGGSRNQWQLVG